MSQRPEHAPETQATQFLKAHKVLALRRQVQRPFEHLRA